MYRDREWCSRLNYPLYSGKCSYERNNAPTAHTAELAFVVLDIAYVQNRILPVEAFYTLMFTCFALNVTCPLFITWWRPYYMGEKALSCVQRGVPQKGGMMGDEDTTAAVHVSDKLSGMVLWLPIKQLAHAYTSIW